MVVRFLHGALRMRPAIYARDPIWDLAVVLKGLSLAPLKPIQSVLEKFLRQKVAFFLAITSLKRMGDLQALSYSPSCLVFASGRTIAILYPRPDCVARC